jgi:signal peptidase I
MTDTDGAAASEPSEPSEPSATPPPSDPVPATSDPVQATPPVDLTKAIGSRRGAHRASPASPWVGYRARRTAKKADKAKKPHRKAPWWELPALVVLAVLIAILVKTFIVQPFYIPSASMEHTLHGCPGCSGDRILVNKLIFDFRNPHPGDIVVFHAPPGWDDEPTSKPPGNPIVRVIRGFGQLVGVVPPDGQVLVKRVVATGGQTVKGDTAGHVMVSKTGPNGTYRTLREPYVFIDAGQENSMRTFGPVTVPKGRLWVMGDHRNDSADSRYHCGVGGIDSSNDTDCDPKASTVPVDNVIGKAFVIAWPPSRWRTLGTPSTFDSAAAGASDLPGIVSASVVLPIFVVRRRRRR